MSNPEREPTMVLSEAVGMLSFAALRALYEEQPALWQMGERGRARTLEDFAHHFESLATLDPDAFSAHVRYCETLFDHHHFPRQWLTDAWRVMALVIGREMPPAVATQAIEVLTSGSAVPAEHPRGDRA
ncbi:MAG TPA: hypothetical protein VIN39_10875 [Candidatus Dormibacteraeota bacterium]|jgi:hypothetical protein